MNYSIPPIKNYQDALMNDSLVHKCAQAGLTHEQTIAAMAERHRLDIEKEIDRARRGAFGPIILGDWPDGTPEQNEKAGAFLEHRQPEGTDNHPCDDWK